MTISTNILGALLKRNLQEKTIRKKYQLVLEESFDGFLLSGADNQIVYCCPSTSNLTGIPVPQLLKTNFTALLHPDDIVDFKRQFKELISGLKPSITTRKRLRTNGEIITWLEIKMVNMLHTKMSKA